MVQRVYSLRSERGNTVRRVLVVRRKKRSLKLSKGTLQRITRTSRTAKTSLTQQGSVSTDALSFLDWRSRAKCKHSTSLMFAHECNARKCKDGCTENIAWIEADSEGVMEIVYCDAVAEARALCMACPVIGQCNAWLWSGEYDSEGAQGIIAATTENERIQFRKQ